MPAARCRSISPGERENGFSMIDVLMAMLIMVIVMTSLSYVMYNSLTDVAYSRQRSAALTLANQAIEEVRSLPPETIQMGMTGSGASGDPTWSQDPNVAGNCFEQQPLDVNGQEATAHCGGTSWTTPTCNTVAASAPSASSLQTPAPLSPHLGCYLVGGKTYGVAVYLTGNPNALPLTVWAAVWWTHPIRGGLEDHVVTTTSLSSCLVVGTTCRGAP